MKSIHYAAMGVCLLVSASAHAQTNDDTTTHFTPPVMGKDKDSVRKSDSKKEEYKSKEWHQGVDRGDGGITDTMGGSRQKHGSGRKPKKPVQPTPATPATPLKK